LMYKACYQIKFSLLAYMLLSLLDN
jgi:hypothetical protein